jgi:PPOX class probable F420-dependent enzyme
LQQEPIIMPKLTEQELTSFLAERGHLARIATISKDGAPSVVPVWFVFEKNQVLITPRKHSVFYENIRRDPRVAITIDEDTGRYRKVLFEGKVQVLFEPGQDRKWDDIYRRIACRYIDEASADYYLTETKDQPRALIGIKRDNAKVTTWRMPGEDEPYSGIWASRYYDKGTKMAETANKSTVATGAKLKVS